MSSMWTKTLIIMVMIGLVCCAGPLPDDHEHDHEDEYINAHVEMEDLKEELRCPICQEVFTKPVKILPCLHSFCSTCLDRFSQSSLTSSSSSSSSSSLLAASPPRENSCPVCKQEYSNTPSDNHFFHSLLDKLEEIKLHSEGSFLSQFWKMTGVIVTKCDLCDQPDPKKAAVRCELCKKDMCNEHQKVHSILLPYHNTIEINDSPSSSPPSQHSPCPHHPHQKLDKMCLKCEVPVCSSCLINGYHQGHLSGQIDKYMDQKKHLLSDLVEDVENRINDLDSSLSFIEQIETKIQESMVSQKAKIISHFDKLRKEFQDLLQRNQEDLLNELETNSKAKLEKLFQQRKQLENKFDGLENSVKVSKSFLKNASNTDLSLHLPLLFDQLIRFKDDNTLLQPPVETRILELDVGHPFNLDDFLQRIKLVEKQPQTLAKELKKIVRDYSSFTSPSFVISNPEGRSDFTPTRCAIDKNNRIIVTDMNRHRVHIFDQIGDLIKSFGSQGSGDGQFDQPWGVAVDKNNRIIVSDINNHRIQIFDENGKFIKSFGSRGSQEGSLDYPQGLAVDKNNRIIVCDTYKHRIKIFDDQGKLIYSIGSYGSRGSGDDHLIEPWGVAVDKNNRIIVSDANNKFHIYDYQGNHIKSFPLTGAENCNHVMYIAVDRHGYFIVSCSERSDPSIFDNEGEFISTLGSKNQNGYYYRDRQNANCIAIDKWGRVIVADPAMRQIRVYG